MPAEVTHQELPPGLRCEAVAVVGARTKTNAGRWRLYAGSVMEQWLPQLDHNEPVLAIVDLESVQARPSLPALFQHWGSVIGRWQDVEVQAEGPNRGVYGSLDLFLPDDEDTPEARERMADAAYVQAMLRRDHAWEASIGEDIRAGGATWERIAPGESVVVNGETVTAGERAIYVGRNLVLGEASVVLFGADAHTGRIAAARRSTTTPQPVTEPATMDQKKPTTEERLKALLAKHDAKHHGLIAGAVVAGKSDQEVDDAVHAAELAAVKAENEQLKAKVAELEAAVAEGDEEEEQDEGAEAAAAAAAAAAVAAAAGAQGTSAPGTPKKAAVAAGANGQTKPQSIMEARRLVAAENPKLKGHALQAETLRRFPDLVPANAVRVKPRGG